MKRVLLIAVALMMATPALAIVTIVGADIGGGQLQISYTTTAGEAPRGIALAIDTGDTGVTVDSGADHVSGDAAFNTFMDWAHGDPVNYNVGDGHGLANSAVAGTPAYPASQFSLSLGVLDTSGGQGAGPTSTLDLATIQLNSTVDKTVNVTITADTLRGPDSGVVGSTLDSNLDGKEGRPTEIIVPVVVGPGECYVWEGQTQAEYDEWAAAGKPECWCWTRQCHGDADGDDQGNPLFGYEFVGTDDLAVLIAGWQTKDTSDPPAASILIGVTGGKYNTPAVCADFNHLRQGNFLFGYERIGTDDLDRLIEYWQHKSGVPADCTPGNVPNPYPDGAN